MSDQEKQLKKSDNWENSIMDIFRKKWYLQKYPNTQVKFIEENVFAVFSNEKNIALFCDRNWDTILNIWYLAESYYFKTACIFAWYIEVKNKNWVYIMYKIKNIDREKKIINPEKIVDKYSEEYFKAWMNIAFFELSLSILLFHKEATDGWYTPQSKEWLLIDIKYKVLKIKDLYEYKQKEQIDAKLFNELLPKVQNLLLEQIWDDRFKRAWREITMEELNFYKNEHLIPEELYQLAKKEFEKVQSLEQKKQEEQRTHMKDAFKWAMQDVLDNLWKETK